MNDDKNVLLSNWWRILKVIQVLYLTLSNFYKTSQQNLI